MLQIPSKMKRSNAKMLQIPLKRQLLAPKCYKFHQNAANSMENERRELQNVAKTVEVEMAASSSKMLQIARKTGRKLIPKKIPKREKNHSRNNSGPYSIYLHNMMIYDHIVICASLTFKFYRYSGNHSSESWGWHRPNGASLGCIGRQDGCHRIFPGRRLRNSDIDSTVEYSWI